MPDDATLVARCRQGDPAAFDALLERYRGPIFAFVLARVACRHTAEDLAQETFVRCLAGLDRLREPAALAGWLFRIAGNLCQDSYRARRDELAPAPRERGGRTASRELIACEQALELARQVARLPERQRVVVLLRHQAGLSCREIATALGAPLGSVTKWLSRAYETLKERVGAKP